MAAKPDLKVVLNFYQTLTPAPGYSTFLDGWHKMGSFVESLDYYLCTLLHKNTDEKGKTKRNDDTKDVKYPYKGSFTHRVC